MRVAGQVQFVLPGLRIVELNQRRIKIFNFINQKKSSPAPDSCGVSAITFLALDTRFRFPEAGVFPEVVRNCAA